MKWRIYLNKFSNIAINYSRFYALKRIFAVIFHDFHCAHHESGFACAPWSDASLIASDVDPDS